MGGPGAAGAVGLVLTRPRHLLRVEPFFMEFISGIEERLAERSMSVLLHLVTDEEAELAAYRRWAKRHLVDVIVVVNPAEGDGRPAALRELGLPAVIAGAPDADPEAPTVRADHVSPVREALARLLDLGHRRVARVSGPAKLLHTGARTEALVEGCRAAGAEEPVTLEGDYSSEAGARLTERLLEARTPPTAILYDNDVMAVAGLESARRMGVPVPERLSLVAWDDSTLCRLTTPALSAMSVDVHQYGVLVAESALERVDGVRVEDRWSPSARFVPRGSTGPAPE